MEAAQPSLDHEIMDMYLTQTDDMAATGERDKWIVKVKILFQDVPFRVDTRLKCITLIVDCHGELKHSIKVLHVYSNHKLQPVATVGLPSKTAESEIVNIS